MTSARKVIAAAAVALTIGAGTTAAAEAASVPVAPAQGANHSSQAAGWHRLWGPTKITASYLNQHGKKWVSRSFDAHSARVIGAFRCWNGGDHSKARLRIYNVETHKWIGDSGAQPCDWTTNYVQNVGGYRDGQPLRFVLTSVGKAHTTEVGAFGAP
ncbi:hypothetical protein ACWEWI_35815 [Streptomyces sp. NPDC003753]